MSRCPTISGSPDGLPTIASHMGMKGFSGMRTASCYPRPASPICRWKGPDGNHLIAVCKPTYKRETGTPECAPLQTVTRSSPTPKGLFGPPLTISASVTGKRSRMPRIGAAHGRNSDNPNQAMKVDSRSRRSQSFLTSPNPRSTHFRSIAASFTCPGPAVGPQTRRSSRKTAATNRWPLPPSMQRSLPEPLTNFLSHLLQKPWLAWFGFLRPPATR